VWNDYQPFVPAGWTFQGYRCSASVARKGVYFPEAGEPLYRPPEAGYPAVPDQVALAIGPGLVNTTVRATLNGEATPDRRACRRVRPSWATTCTCSPTTWAGRHRPPTATSGVYPPQHNDYAFVIP